MKVTGVGPWFGALAGATVAIASIAGRFLPDVLSDVIPSPVRFALAAALGLSGLALWLSGLRTVFPAFAEHRLATTGPYALCRHPVYGAWICLILPALALAKGDIAWLGAAVVLHAGTAMLVRREERWLEATFGDEWRAWRDRTPMFLPLGFATGQAPSK